MKRRRFIKTGLEGIVLASTPSILSANENVVKAKTYFPLHVGNSWTYVKSGDGSTKTFTIIGTEEINGNTYYKFDDYFSRPWYLPEGKDALLTEGREVLLRHDSITDSVLLYIDGKYRIRYNWGDLDRWNRWSSYGFGISRLKREDVTCIVPAGEFSDCINFQFGATYCGEDAYEFGEYLAPNVGNVRYVWPGGECLRELQEGCNAIYELQKYEIKGTTYIEEENPTEFSLKNYPNPFNNMTTIEYNLPGRSRVRLDVYNSTGQFEKTLVDKVQNPGLYQVKFDASNLSSGLYFYRLTTPNSEKTEKMMLVK